jgi:hypothetical protein
VRASAGVAGSYLAAPSNTRDSPREEEAHCGPQLLYSKFFLMSSLVYYNSSQNFSTDNIARRETIKILLVSESLYNLRVRVTNGNCNNSLQSKKPIVCSHRGTLR